MKKLLTVFGIIIWLLVILCGALSFSQSHAYNDLAAIAFIIVVPLLIICIVKNKRKKAVNADGESSKKTVDTDQSIKEEAIPSGVNFLRCAGRHVNGLNLAENMMCEVLSYNDHYEINARALKFNLSKSKVADVIVKSDTEIQKQYVSSIGGAVGGAVLFGPIGAMIGGRAKQKTIKKTSHYMIITYRNDSDELKYIGLDVTNSYFNAQKFVKEFSNSNKTVTNIDL